MVKKHKCYTNNDNWYLSNVKNTKIFFCPICMKDIKIEVYIILEYKVK